MAQVMDNIMRGSLVRKTEELGEPNNEGKNKRSRKVPEPPAKPSLDILPVDVRGEILRKLPPDALDIVSTTSRTCHEQAKGVYEPALSALGFTPDQLSKMKLNEMQTELDYHNYTIPEDIQKHIDDIDDIEGNGELDLQSRKLTTGHLKKILESLKGKEAHVKELYLRENNLKSLPESIGSLSALLRLNIEPGATECLPFDMIVKVY